MMASVYKWSCVFALLAAFALPSAATAQQRRVPLDLQAGFEQNRTTLEGPDGMRVRGQEGASTSNPVFKIISPIKLGCVGQSRVFNRGTSSERRGCIGFGGRFSGSQKRLEGEWFERTATSTTPSYNFRSDQIAGELLFGQLSEVSFAVALGLRAGLNNYDLQVTDNNTILFDQRNKFRGFASWAFYLDLQVLLSWPFFGVFTWPFDNVFFLYSFEETFPGANSFTVPDINNPGSEIDVDFQLQTHTITIEFIF